MKILALFALLIFSGFGLFHCAGSKSPADKSQTTMENYDTLWKKILDAEKNGLPQTGLSIADTIYDKAISEKNDVQQIKALIYKTKYTSQLDEDGVVKGISIFQAGLQQASDPIVKSLLHSLLAQLYSNYFQMHLWEIRDRTSTQGISSPDIMTWSKEDFLTNVRSHYLASLLEPLLQSTEIGTYLPLLTEAKNTDSLRPYVYDILAHRAIDYFLDSRADLDIVDDPLLLNDPLLFSHTDQFVQYLADQPQGTNSFAGQVIRLFQDLERFHRKDKIPIAWVDVVKKRLQYGYDHFVGSEKDRLYESALNQWITAFAHTPSAAPFELAKAQLYASLGHQYNAATRDSIYRGYLVKAVSLCQSIRSKYKNTVEAIQADNLLKELNRPSLTSQTEKVNLPAQPFRILLGYRNVTKIYVRIIPISPELRSELAFEYRQDAIDRVSSGKAVQTFSQAVPGSSDMQSHEVEIKVDPLPSGLYGIVLSSGEGFKKGDDVLALMFTHVSNIAYLHAFNQYMGSSRPDYAKELIVVDRTSGGPMQGVEAVFYENTYNQNKQRSEWLERGKATSDAEGRISPQLVANKSYTVKLQKGGDQLWLDEAFSNSSYRTNPTTETLDGLFFLDRSIYRPGQAIYFKMLALQRNERGVPKVLKNKSIQITLNDANGQMVSKQSFISNDYGTIHGSFMAPATGLTGSMTLVSDLNYVSAGFQVEEYKRPKFEITFDSNQVVNTLNQPSIISGEAKNYAGNPVDQATVKYKITRMRWQRPMPWWLGWKTYFPSRSNPVILSQGTGQTDLSGKFKVPFTAIPDPTVDITEDDVSFIYSVEVDITDFTGETRSSSVSYRIGTHNLLFSTSLGQYELTDSLSKITLKATDLNDSPISIAGELTISKLMAPATFYRSSYWNQPDQYIYTSDEYHRWFPKDAFKNENEVTTWKTESIILQSEFNSNTAFTLSKKLAPGIYKLALTTKNKLQPASKFEQYFWVNDPANGVFPAQQAMVAYQDKDRIEPGQILSYKLRTLTPIKFLLQSSSEILKSEWVPTTGLLARNKSLTEKDRGTTHQIQWYTVLDNRIYTQQVTYGMTWTTKDLDFETISFRDKLLPGQTEEWSLKIKGQPGDKIVAEIVASMYDQSLDALYPQAWRRDLYSMYTLPISIYTAAGFATEGVRYISDITIDYEAPEPLMYRDLDWFGFNLPGRMYTARAGAVYKSTAGNKAQSDGMVSDQAAPAPEAAEQLNDQVAGPAKPSPESPSSVRKNLNETVFFYPNIKTDSAGNFIIKFKMNEALTRWRLMLFGHTTDLKNAYLEKEVVTQKDLMVFPNGPRFLRQGDLLEFPAKVSNLKDKPLSGAARLELFDPVNGARLDLQFNLINPSIPFKLAAGQSSPLSWQIMVPKDYTGMLGYRVIAETGSMSDGEENVIPVLTNRMLVTESFPFQVRAHSQKSFVFQDLLDKIDHKSLVNHSYTLEGTSNPTWYAIQALPYLMEHQFECTEQIVNRYFANALATSILESNPKIKTVFDQWLKKGDLKSPLSKNEELKAAVLAETPWVRDALSEEEQQKMIALLFDVNKMTNEKNQTITLLTQKQLSNGGFPWFEGRDDWYITQYVVETLGHLKKLGILDPALNEVLGKSVLYCDRELVKYYNELKKSVKKEQIGLTDMAIHYLYTRSFFMDLPIEDKEAFEYFLGQAREKWLTQSLYSQGMIALAVHRWQSSSPVPGKILASLKEKAQHSEVLGMYWKFDSGYRFFELPIETQALMIEAFSDITRDAAIVDEMRLWLLKNKQTNRWHSTKATAAAIYSLLLFGDSWITETKLPGVTLDHKKILIVDDQTTAGLGYFKIKKEASQIDRGLSNITVDNPNNQVMWGAAYWQYFEDMDKITSFKNTPLSIKKQIMVEKVQNNKIVLQPVTELKVGDKVVIRIEIKTDRPMDYIHLKDMRASGLEPVNVISSYKYQGGLGYYESTKDLATHFFFDHINPGTYILEYALRVAQQGQFSNGISTIECMYAPEFSGHSAGEIVIVKK